jgi:5-methylcytosine-specific restriction endonuclease McrA
MNAIREPWQGKLPRLTGHALQKRNDRIKKRDGYKCADCGRITDQLEIDHIVPLSKGGSDTDDTNLQLLCATPNGTGCHARKTAKEKGQRVRLGCDVNGNPIGGWPK